MNFIEHKPLRWRSKNDGVCDSPSLYFAIIPNGDMAVCCDYRLGKRISTIDPDFPRQYAQRIPHQQILPIARACDGCMYGSFPEISTTARFYSAMWDHAKILLAGTRMVKNWPLSADELFAIADQILTEHPPVEHPAAASRA